MKTIQPFISILLTLLVSSSHYNGEKIAKKAKDKEKTKSEHLTQKNIHPLPTEVAVIGAGISGLSAARFISRDRSNFTVTVYEARMDRYGGRVWTDKLRNMKAKGISTFYIQIVSFCVFPIFSATKHHSCMAF